MRNSRGTTEYLWHKHGEDLAKDTKLRVLEKLLLRIQEVPD
jgi:hypothetical protein